MHVKRLAHALLAIGSVAATWKLLRLVALASYSKKGPFIANSAPPIDQIFLNGLEGYLNAGVAKSGVPISSWFGPISVGTTTARYNHNLHDATGTSITPDVVVLNVCGRYNSLHTVSYDNTTMNSTGVEITADAGTLTVTGVAYKF